MQAGRAPSTIAGRGGVSTAAAMAGQSAVYGVVYTIGQLVTPAGSLQAGGPAGG